MVLVNLHQALIDLADRVDIVHSYLVTDERAMPDHAEIGLIEGGVRTSHDEEVTKEVRSRCHTVVAFGSCAAFGGILGLANSTPLPELEGSVYGKPPSIGVPRPLSRIRPISELIDVNWVVPGCPPEASETIGVLAALLKGEKPELPLKNVCYECKKQQSRVYSSRARRLHESPPDARRCMLELGYLCMGPATRAGCSARCLEMNIPCEGCRGPSDAVGDQGLAMMDALSTVAYPLLERYDHLEHSTALHRFTLAKLKADELQRGGAAQ